MELGKKLVGVTLGIATLAADATRHAVWLVTYHMDRRSRPSEEERDQS